MQFAVPQFTEVEDRLIGRLTLKQFLVLLGTGGVVLFFWSILGPTIIFFILSLPVAIVGIASALGRYNGRPMFAYLMPFAAFLSSTRIMIFKREVAVTTVSKSRLKSDAKTEQSAESLEPAESRLKKLAYLLDRKTEEEGEIITHDKDDMIAAARLAPKPAAPKMQFSKIVDRTRQQIMDTARKLDAGSYLHKSPAKPKPVIPAPMEISQPETPVTPASVKFEPEYEPRPEETIDFTKMEELEEAPKPIAKPKPALRAKKPAAPKKAGKKFDPSSFLDPNA
jgi:hypothetical protein